MRSRSIPAVLVLVPLLGACGPGEESIASDDVAGLPAASPGPASDGSWRQWGGPGGDFKVSAPALRETWPPEGPRELWSRPLGKGCSAVAADGGVLYTMYRAEGRERAVAVSARDGETVWEHGYEAPTRKGHTVQFGKGPNATPLVLDDRVVTLGYTGALLCLSRDTGKVLWSHGLLEDLGGELLTFGYSASPILHDGAVIVLVGGEQGAVAFEAEDGSIRWKSPAGTVSYATPEIIQVDGQEQLVMMSADEVIGLDASDGRRLWSHPVVNQYRNNATDPIWIPEDGLLWVPTQLDGGTRVLRLQRQGDGTRVEEVWSSNKISIHFWNSLRLGDHVYASIGGQASVLAGIDVRTGEIQWRERGFSQVNFVHAGDWTILFDEEGQLALARLSPEGMKVQARARIVDEKTWTPPTLVGTTLYVRDQTYLRALDLGA